MNILNSEEFPISLKGLKVQMAPPSSSPFESPLEVDWPASRRFPAGRKLPHVTSLFHVGPALSGSYNGKAVEGKETSILWREVPESGLTVWAESCRPIKMWVWIDTLPYLRVSVIRRYASLFERSGSIYLNKLEIGSEDSWIWIKWMNVNCQCSKEHYLISLF